MANSAESKVDSLPDLDDLLQCPVCYEIPSGQIFQCNEGHHVCGRCKARLDQCPVCRALFFGTRNYAMEELIASVKKLQAFKLGGKLTVSSNSAHGSESTASAENSVSGTVLESIDDEATSESSTVALRAPPACKGVFRCLCCRLLKEEPAKLPSGRLLNHLRYYHSNDLIEGKSQGGEYVQAWHIPIPYNRSVITAIRVSDMGIFFLVIEFKGDIIHAWVSMAASPWVALEYCYTITISGNDREAVFSDCVWSVRSCEGTLKKRGRSLCIRGADLQALASSDVICVRLVIKRAPAEGGILHAQPRAVLRVANRGATEMQPLNNEPEIAPSVIQPFLQGYQNDVAGLQRVFADLGRQPQAVIGDELNLNVTDSNAVAAALGAVAPPPLPPVAPPPLPPVAPPPLPSVAPTSEMSRSARRRMQRRLNSNRSVDSQRSHNESPINNGEPEVHHIGYIRVEPFRAEPPPEYTHPVQNHSTNTGSSSSVQQADNRSQSHSGPQSRNKKKRRQRR